MSSSRYVGFTALQVDDLVGPAPGHQRQVHVGGLTPINDWCGA